MASLNTREYDESIAFLKGLHEEAGYGQEALSRKLGQSPNYVFKVEHKDHRLNVVEFCWLAEALGLY